MSPQPQASAKSREAGGSLQNKMDEPIRGITKLERIVIRRLCKERGETDEERAMFLKMLIDEPRESNDDE